MAHNHPSALTESLTTVVLPKSTDWSMVSLYIIVGVAIYVQFCRHQTGRAWTNPVRADRRVCIVTGATSGIGHQTALGLAERGATVVLACRDLPKARRICDNIIRRTGNTQVSVRHLDLGNLTAVRRFASDYHGAYGTRRLDVLILNAGVMAVPWRLNDDGLEQHMAVNHYGHFALAMLLLERMQATRASRIVVVSSMSHRWVRLRPDDLNGARGYNRFHAYAHSKLANVLFVAELARREGRFGVTVNAVHPGVVHTEVSRNLVTLSRLLNRNVCAFFSYIALRSARSGAKCSLYAALDFNLDFVTGHYFEDLWFAPVNEQMHNRRLCEWFWQHSEKVTGTVYAERVVRCRQPSMMQSQTK